MSAYFLWIDEAEIGPMSRWEVAGKLADGTATAETPCRLDGGEWSTSDAFGIEAGKPDGDSVESSPVNFLTTCLLIVAVFSLLTGALYAVSMETESVALRFAVFIGGVVNSLVFFWMMTVVSLLDRIARRA